MSQEFKLTVLSDNGDSSNPNAHTTAPALAADGSGDPAVVDTGASSSSRDSKRRDSSKKTVQDLRYQFMALERRVGLDIAENSLDYIRHMPPNQLAEIAGEMFLMIQGTLSKHEEAVEESRKRKEKKKNLLSPTAAPTSHQQNEHQQNHNNDTGMSSDSKKPEEMSADAFYDERGGGMEIPTLKDADDDVDDEDDDDDSQCDFFKGPQLSIEVATPNATGFDLHIDLPTGASGSKMPPPGSGHPAAATTTTNNTSLGDEPNLSSFLEQQQHSEGSTSSDEGLEDGRANSQLRVSPSARSSVSVDGYETINEYTVIDTIGRGACGKVLLAVKEGEPTTYAIKQMPRSFLLQRADGSVSPGLPESSRSAEPDSSSHVAVLPGGSSVAGGDAQPLLLSPGADTPNTGAISTRGGGGGQQQRDSVDMLALQREVAVQKRLRHKNIVPLFEVIDDPEGGNFYLVMQYISQGPLLTNVGQGRFEPVEPSKCRHYFRQMVSGLSYLEKHHVLHLDIKPDNILISSEDVVYLADFGMSEIVDTSVTSPSALAAMRTRSMYGGSQRSMSQRSMDGSSRQASVNRPNGFIPDNDSSSSQHLGSAWNNQQEPRHRPVSPRPGHAQQKGTPAFMSPEMCLGDEDLTTATDVWSLGVTLYCMLFGELPFKGTSWGATVQSICNDDYEIPSDAVVEPAWIDILETMICKDPLDRTTLHALKCHPFLRERSDSLGRGGYSPHPGSVGGGVGGGGSLRGSDKGSAGGHTPRALGELDISDVITKRVKDAPSGRGDQVKRQLPAKEELVAGKAQNHARGSGGGSGGGGSPDPGSTTGASLSPNINSGRNSANNKHMAGSGLRAIRRRSTENTVDWGNSQESSPKTPTQNLRLNTH